MRSKLTYTVMVLASLLASHSHAITATKEYVDRQDAAVTNIIQGALDEKADIQRITEKETVVTHEIWTLADNKRYFFPVDGEENLWSLNSDYLGTYLAYHDDGTWQYWAVEKPRGSTLSGAVYVAPPDATSLDFRTASFFPAWTWLLTRGTMAVTNRVAVTNTVVYSDALENGLTLGGDGNATGYRYDGVNVTRGGESDDYLWGTTNAQGVVRFKDLAPIITSICLDLMGNIYWQSDDGGRTMDAYYRDAQTISNIVSAAVSFVANGQGNAYIIVEDGNPGLWMADESDAGGVADRNAENTQGEEASHE